ncbi:hypothetical protein BRADI_3g40313v3 [Brachypodium distachyon]|uniref:Reverse transcriptase zinc-binding domain-containing protein n=1 Tax=Brachypodium distachyon TaxID=15368 RepID=A0A0Q3IEI4_BRADI|nr:hypothetical protein BRADI_3g40313v3 [Brachypodium distachyon]
MVRKNGEWDTTYRFCPEFETIHHLFFTCAAAHYTWSVVGLAIGANSRPSSFMQYFWWISNHIKINRNVQIVDLICYACSFLKYWAGLQAGADGDALLEGDRVLKEEAMKHHHAQAAVDVRRLEGKI